MDLWYAIVSALGAQAALSTGQVLMKRGIAWIGWPHAKDRLYLRTLSVWIAGFLILNSSGPFTALAVKRLSPQIVSGFAGFGLVSLILLSRWLLREPLFRSDIPGTLLILIPLGLLGFLPSPSDNALWRAPSAVMVLVTALFPILCLALGLFSRRRQEVVFALTSGSATGYMVVILKWLVAQKGYQVARYPESPHLYLYILFALTSLIAMQWALKRGAMMTVGPVQLGATLAYPALCQTLLGFPVPLWQWICFTLIALGCWIILRKR